MSSTPRFNKRQTVSRLLEKLAIQHFKIFFRSRPIRLAGKNRAGTSLKMTEWP